MWPLSGFRWILAPRTAPARGTGRARSETNRGCCDPIIWLRGRLRSSICRCPILRAIKKRHGPVALIHVDAHADINDTMFGEKVAHGCPFRRAWEDGCLINDKVFQIGFRGTGYSPDDFDWGREKGWTVVQAEECWHKSLVPLMEKIRAQIGDAPVYLSYDIDSLDPAFAPGTGTVEPGGLTIWQGLEIVRGCAGLNLVGGDLVEVSPPYDPSGNTALIGANLLYEMLCVLPKVPQGVKRG